MNDLLTKIAYTANLNDSEKDKLIASANDYHYSRMLKIIVEKHPEFLKELSTTKSDSDKSIQNALQKHPSLIKDIEKITDEVIDEIVDAVNQSATEEQKKQILAALPK